MSIRLAWAVINFEKPALVNLQLERMETHSIRGLQGFRVPGSVNKN